MGLGYLNLCKWFKTVGLPWNSETCACAAKGDFTNSHSPLALSSSFALNTDFCEAGQIEVLEWLLNEHCPYKENVLYKAAAKFNHMEVSTM